MNMDKDIMEAMRDRHAVRQYREQPLGADVTAALQAEIDTCNELSGLHIQLVTDDPAAFSGMMAHYGNFKGVRNYIALVGRKSDHLEKTCGYYGERIVLKAQMLGLNTCWVAMTFSKNAARKKVILAPDEQLVIVIAVGYGETSGTAHKSKPIEQLCRTDTGMPDWFRAGMEAAALAPTAVNQQKFCFTLSGDTVHAASLGGFYSNIDLGIAVYHFELGSGKKTE